MPFFSKFYCKVLVGIYDEICSAAGSETAT